MRTSSDSSFQSAVSTLIDPLTGCQRTAVSCQLIPDPYLIINGKNSDRISEKCVYDENWDVPFVASVAVAVR